MRAQGLSHPVAKSAPDLYVSLATAPEEIEEACRLRAAMIGDESGAASECGVLRGVDIFDRWCEHLVVRDRRADRLVAAARILTGDGAARLGAYRSETEFDLTRLQRIRPYLLEVDDLCLDPRYRSSGALEALWQAVASLMPERRCRYVIGCVTVGTADGGAYAAALWRQLVATRFAPIEYRVFPRHPYEPDAPAADAFGARPVVPGPLESYLSMGAWIASEPAMASDANAVEFCLFLPQEQSAASSALRRYAA